jgi:DNA-binding transcriptional regulator YiaG
MRTEIGSDTRRIRQRFGMTQEEFAHAIAVTASTVNRWENDRATPSARARGAIELLVENRGMGAAAAGAAAMGAI